MIQVANNSLKDADSLSPMVTSECGTQAAFDTVCRGSQVTPLTRDAGCQYEDTPSPMTTRSPTGPSVIKPSPLKQGMATSPSKDQENQSAVFMAAKALQQLQQRPVINSNTVLRPTGPKELLTNGNYETGAFTKPIKLRNKQRSLGVGCTAYQAGWYSSPYPTPLPTPTHELSTLTVSSDKDAPPEHKPEKLKTQTHEQQQQQTTTKHKQHEHKPRESYGTFPLVGPISANANALVVPVPHKPEIKPYQSGTGNNTLLPSQIKALQQQSSLQDSFLSSKVEEKKPSLANLDSSLLHSLGVSPEAKTPTSLMSSLLQPQSLVGSLPLTSYALLLDMFHRQQPSSVPSTANNAHLVNHLNQLQALSKQHTLTGRAFSSLNSPHPTSTGIIKPTPTTLNGDITATTTVLGSVPSPLTTTSNTSTPGSLFGNGGLLSNSNVFLGRNSPVIPTMLNKPSSHFSHKRGALSETEKRDLDIESLVDSVIDDHMSHDSNRSNYNNHSHHHHIASSLHNNSQKCFRSDSLSDYDMTPPFKRRRRTVFTEKQLQGLEEAYSRSQYLDRESRLELCKKLSLSLHTVVYWFQNKRAISRRRGHSLDSNTNVVNNVINGTGGGSISASSSVENIHSTFSVYKSSDTSPSYKHTPPTSPSNNEYNGYSSSPVKASMLSNLVSPRRPSPPSSMTNMSTTLTATSAISKNVLNVKHILGATM